MKTAIAALAALFVLALVPATQAQDQGQAFELAVNDLAAPIPYAGSSTLSFNLTVGCINALRLAGETMTATPMATVALAADAPTWITAEEASVDVSPDETCLSGGGNMVKQGTIAVTVGKDAPGVVDQIVNFTATLAFSGAPATSTDDAVLKVAYHANYTLTTDAKFPLTVTQTKTSFNLTAQQCSNARSMIMMEEVKASAGVIAGMASTVYESGPGKCDSKVFKITYTAPDGAWNQTTVQFKGYSHYLLKDSRAGPFNGGTAVKWDFTNGGVHSATEKTPDKKSPAPVAALTALGLVGLAAALRRRA